MKSTSFKLTIFLCLLLFQSVDAQIINLGFRGGMNTLDIEAEDFIILDNSDQEIFKAKVKNAEYGFHGGMFFRLNLGTLFIQPEALISSNRINYTWEDLTTNRSKDISFDIYSFDVPLMIGLKFGPLRVQGGPVANFTLDDFTDLGDGNSYNNLTYGYQIGAGLDIWRFQVDLKYENNLSGLGDALTIEGERFRFNSNPQRMVLTLGYAFFHNKRN